MNSKKTLVLCFSLLCYSAAHANLEGFHVVAGEAAAPVQDSSGALVITSGKQAVIQWDKFSIDAQEIARFVQADASSAVLNRVMGKEMSALLGKLESNGKIYLINSNGVLIGPDAHIDCAGFLASTLDILDQDFMQGKELLFQGDSLQSVINQGTISTPRGDIYLIAKTVSNEGRLSAPEGDVGLFSTSSVLIKPAEQNKIFIRSALAQETLNQEIKEGASPYSYAISHSGEIEAGALRTEGGRVYLVADSGDALVSGKITAPSGEVRVHASEEITLASSAEIDSSGPHGGQVYIGGEKSGKEGPFFNSKCTTVEEGAWIYADGLDTDAGQVICWADDTMRFDGQISAQGLGSLGDGGFAEISGHDLYLTGHANLLSRGGAFGTLLVDPGRVVINHSMSMGLSTFGDSYISGQLGMGNFTILTSAASGPGAESVTFSNALGAVAISWSQPTTFGIVAGQSINMSPTNTTITSMAAGAFTAINWQANANSSASFNGITIAGAISTIGGNIVMTGTAGTTNTNMGISIVSTGSIRSTGIGQINLTGIGSTAQLAIGIGVAGLITTSSTGTITLTGTGGSGAAGGNIGIGLNLATGIVSSTSLLSTAGSISIFGNGGTVSIQSHGVAITNHAKVTSTNGNIFIQGTGSAASGVSTLGINIAQGTVSITGVANPSATLTLQGSGGAGTGCSGISMNNVAAIVSSQTGTINITGTGGNTGTASHGLTVAAGTVTAAGSTVLNITGTGATGASAGGNGINIVGPCNISVVNANLTMTGTASTQNTSIGILAIAGLSITSSGSGSLLFSGTGATNAATGSNIGIQLGGTVKTTSSGVISVMGIGGQGLNNSHGIQQTGALISTGTSAAQILLNGTASLGGGTGSSGISFSIGSSMSTVDAAIMVTGISNTASSQNIGITGSTTISSTGAASISFTGTGSSTATSSPGIFMTGGSTTCSGLGQITLTGTGHGMGDGDKGILLQQTSASTTSGNLTLIGNGSTVATTNNHGIQITGGASNISTVSGQISLQGTAGGTGAIGNVGVEVSSGGMVNVTGSGSVIINGTSNLAAAAGLTSPAFNFSGLGSQINSTGPVTITANKAGNDLSTAIQIANGAVLSLTGSGSLSMTATNTALGGTGIFISDSGTLITTTSTPITMTGIGAGGMAGLVIVEGGLVNSGSTLSVQSNNDMQVLGSFFLLGAFSQSSAAGIATYTIGGNLIVQGGLSNGSFAQIGNSTGTAIAGIQFTNIGGDVTVIAQDPSTYALIGHGALSGAPAALSANINFNSIGGTVNVTAATGGPGAGGFAQIGHLNPTSGIATISGDINLTAQASLLLTGGDAASSYAQIGHGGQTGGTTIFGPCDMMLIAGVNTILTSNVGLAQIVNPSQTAGSGNLTLVVDNLFPSPPSFGPGELTLNSLLTATGQLKIYTSQQSLNVINSPINGSLFIPGPIGVDSNTEEFEIYFPGGTYGGANFKFYYKTGFPVPPPGPPPAPPPGPPPAPTPSIVNGDPIFPGKDFFHTVAGGGASHFPVIIFPPFSTADAVSIYFGRFCTWNKVSSSTYVCDPRMNAFGSFIFEDRVYYWTDER